MSRVLWIEDQVDADLPDLFARAVAGGHEITIAVDATEALEALRQEFDFVVVDIRIPPGVDPRWSRHFYETCMGNKTTARLGIELLRSVWQKAPAVRLQESERPRWLTPQKAGVLSVEGYEDVGPILKDLGLKEEQYLSKMSHGDPSGQLLWLIRKLQEIENAVRRGGVA